MSTLSKVGRTLEYGVYSAVVVYAFKVVVALIFGYLLYTTECAGPAYFRWRKDYCDMGASKVSYGYIDPNTEDRTELFNTFSSAVQPAYNPKLYNQEMNELQSTVEKLKDSWWYKNTFRLASIRLAELSEEVKPQTEVTEESTTPLYSVGSFTDTFIIKPQKTFKIFAINSNGEPYNKPALDAEFDFLAFRHIYLRYMSDLTAQEEINIRGERVMQASKNYVAITRKQVEDFFLHNDLSVQNVIVNEKPCKRIFHINGRKLKTPITLSEKQFAGYEKYLGVYKPFMKLVAYLENEDKEPIVTFADGKVESSDEFYSIVEEIIEQLGLESLFIKKGQALTPEEIRAEFNLFLNRLSLLKPHAFDVHILNRFYYYYLFVKSYLEPASDPQKSDGKYSELKKQVDKLAEEIEDQVSKSANVRDLVTKRNVYKEKLTKRRVELMFNHLSFLIARKLGDKGFVLKSQDENRNILARLLGCYPGVYGEGDAEKLRVHFEEYPAA